MIDKISKQTKGKDCRGQCGHLQCICRELTVSLCFTALTQDFSPVGGVSGVRGSSLSCFVLIATNRLFLKHPIP